MIKKGYWSEIFSQQEIVIIKGAWVNVFKLFLNNEDKELELKKSVKKECSKNQNSVFMHCPKPENDKEDGWIGVEPETFKSFFTSMERDITETNVIDIVKLFTIFKQYQDSETYPTSMLSFKDEDGLTDWDKAGESFVSFISKTSELKTHTSKIIDSCWLMNEECKNLKEVIDDIKKEEAEKALLDLGISSDEWSILNKTYSVDQIQTKMNELNEKWSAEYKYIPTLLSVRLQSPSRPLLKILKKRNDIQKIVESVLNNLDFSLSNFEKEVHTTNICLIYSSVKVTEELVIDCIKNNKNLELVTKPIIDCFLNKKTVNLTSSLTYKDAISLLNLPKEGIEFAANFPSNKYNLASKAYELCKGNIELAYEFIKHNVSKFRWNDYKNLSDKAIAKNVIDKFEKFRSLSHKEREYTAYIAPKTSAKALVSGDATDCCMNPDYKDEGWECVVGAALEKNQAIFLIEKDKVTYAQSWIWISSFNGKKAICFDSIETVFKEKEQLLLIYRMLHNFAKLLIETKKVDLVWFGERNILTTSSVDSMFYEASGDILSNGFITIMSLDKLSEKTQISEDVLSELTKKPNWIIYSDMSAGSDIAVIAL